MIDILVRVGVITPTFDNMSRFELLTYPALGWVLYQLSYMLFLLLCKEEC